MPWWLPAVISAGSSIVGRIAGGRAKDQAEEETAEVAAAARRAAARADRRTTRKADKRVDRRADRAERRIDRQADRWERKAGKISAQTLSVSQAAAKAERKQVRKDEATRFVRLREAAEKGGFNPLTVLEAGFTGASLPTGILSADWHLSAGGMKLDTLSAGMSTRMSLDGQVQGQRIQGALDAMTLGQNASALMHDQIMGGHEAAVQAGQAAYERSANMWRDIGNAAVSALDARQHQQNQDRSYELDRQRLDLDREQFAFERDYNERVFQANQATARSPGYGGSRLGSWSEPVLSEGGAPTFTMNGRTYEGNANVDSEENIGNAVGQMGGEAIKLVANLPHIDRALQDLLLWDPLRAYQDAFWARESVGGAAWGTVTDLWSGQQVGGFNVPMSQEELDLVPSWAR